MKHLFYPGAILRDTGEFLHHVREESELKRTSILLLSVSFLFFALYGFVMGWSGGLLQAIASAAKMPVLFLLTLFICLPTLHLLNLIFGSKQSIMQQLVLLLAAIAITATLLLGFAPVTAFFMTTTRNYAFIKLLNVLVVGFSSSIGVKFFASMMKNSAPEDPTAPIRQRILTSWIILYMFVGTQLAWTLRPFIGDPDRTFQWFRSVHGNFYIDVIRSIEKLMGM